MPIGDAAAMDLAITAAETSRLTTSPNPWVGAAVIARDGQLVGTGSTQPPGGAHAEVMALREAGERAHGGTIHVTLEPCAHHGRTPPCTDALIAAGVSRVVVGADDPDPAVAGKGWAALEAAGIQVERSPSADAATAQLEPYLHHRRTGRPYVVLKMAMTLDGRTAAPDSSSFWITGEQARRDVHRLRAESDAILVGAGTVRADDPSLTVRDVEGSSPTRFVLGSAPPEAKVHPCREVSGDLETILDTMGAEGNLQLLVEGGAGVAGEFHRLGLVDRYVIYMAPALMGGDDGRPLFTGDGVSTMADLWRGEFIAVTKLGNDLRLDLAPSPPASIA